MFRRQRSGSVVCPSCGRLVGVNDEKCFNCGRPRPGMWGFTPLLRRLGQDLGFVELVIGGCAVLFVACLAVHPAGIGVRGGLFSFLSPSGESLFLLGASGALPVVGYGRWWTLLSAGWLHGSLLHIVFNVLWIRQLAPPVAEYYGPGRMVIVYTASGIAGFALSTAGQVFLAGVPLLGGGAMTVGASAPIFGLLGALVWYGRRVSGVVGRQAWMFAIVLFLFGFFWRHTDNLAHLGGFLGGVGVAALLNPMKPERVDHAIVAIACLLATAAAVAASVITGLAPLR